MMKSPAEVSVLRVPAKVYFAAEPPYWQTMPLIKTCYTYSPGYGKTNFEGFGGLLTWAPPPFRQP